MNSDPLTLEASLRAARLKRPTAAFLEQTLAAAMAEQERASTAAQEISHKHRGMVVWYSFIPRPMRWAIAACWLLAFIFRLMTPPVIPSSSQAAIARIAAPTRAALLAHHQQVQELSYELFTHPSDSIPRL